MCGVMTSVRELNVSFQEYYSWTNQHAISHNDVDRDTNVFIIYCSWSLKGAIINSGVKARIFLFFLTSLLNICGCQVMSNKIFNTSKCNNEAVLSMILNWPWLLKWNPQKEKFSKCSFSICSFRNIFRLNQDQMSLWWDPVSQQGS